ncbi:uncharacterized protein METZ01_LOCUS361870 [marine metagenome]|uniref:Uncharacterized protein n=1 Tax=marine metagenome TaxID=408172 RepID=A0A382SGN3_9ZZZZ
MIIILDEFQFVERELIHEVATIWYQV